jgi:hypothetical protein
LNSDEAAAFDSASSQFSSFLKQLRVSQEAVVANKTSLSPADFASLAALLATRDVEVNNLAATIMSTVRPETAARLHTPGQMLADTISKQGVN